MERIISEVSANNTDSNWQKPWQAVMFARRFLGLLLTGAIIMLFVQSNPSFTNIFFGLLFGIPAGIFLNPGNIFNVPYRHYIKWYRIFSFAGQARQVMSFKGEAGWQPQKKLPGWRYCVVAWNNVSFFQFTKVPTDAVWYLISRLGHTLEQGRKTGRVMPAQFAELKVEQIYFYENPIAFMQIKGQIGIQRSFLTPGYIGPVDLIAFQVDDGAQPDSVPPELEYYKPFIVPDNHFAMVVCRDSAHQQKMGSIIARTEGFADIEDHIAKKFGREEADLRFPNEEERNKATKEKPIYIYQKKFPFTAEDELKDLKTASAKPEDLKATKDKPEDLKATKDKLKALKAAGAKPEDLKAAEDKLKDLKATFDAKQKALKAAVDTKELKEKWPESFKLKWEDAENSEVSLIEAGWRYAHDENTFDDIFRYGPDKVREVSREALRLLLKGPEEELEDYQNIQKFDEIGGTVGRHWRLIRPGKKLNINRFVFDIKLVKPVQVEPGTCQVMILSTGVLRNDITHPDFSGDDIVWVGGHGINSRALEPGHYPIAPELLQLVTIPTRQISLFFGSHSYSGEYDKDLPQVVARSKDGINVTYEFNVIMSIPAEAAPVIVSAFGNANSFITDVVAAVLFGKTVEFIRNTIINEIVINQEKHLIALKENLVNEVAIKYGVRIHQLRMEYFEAADYLTILEKKAIAEAQKQVYDSQTITQAALQILNTATAKAEVALVNQRAESYSDISEKLNSITEKLVTRIKKMGEAGIPLENDHIVTMVRQLMLDDYALVLTGPEGIPFSRALGMITGTTGTQAIVSQFSSTGDGQQGNMLLAMLMKMADQLSNKIKPALDIKEIAQKLDKTSAKKEPQAEKLDKTSKEEPQKEEKPDNKK